MPVATQLFSGRTMMRRGGGGGATSNAHCMCGPLRASLPSHNNPVGVRNHLSAFHGQELQFLVETEQHAPVTWQRLDWILPSKSHPNPLLRTGPSNWPFWATTAISRL